TSEWEGYRWGPISTRAPSTGLLDEEGYFHRKVALLCEQADPTAVRAEMRAQIEQARRSGINPTHIDCHMHAAVNVRLISDYVQLGIEQNLPTLLRRDLKSQSEETKLLISRWEERGFPIFDKLHIMYLLGDPAEDQLPRAKKAFDDLPPGLTCML